MRSAQYKELNYPELPKSSADRGHSAPSSPATGTLGLDGESGELFENSRISSLSLTTVLVRRPRQADLSKHISLEWKSLTDEEKAPYVRMSEEAKLVHARIYPGYKYQPRRKIEGTSGGKKSGLRPEASKKHAKSKKSGKESKTTKRDEHRRETEVDDKPSEQSDEQSQAVNDMAIAHIQLPSVSIEITGDGQEDGTSAGDPSKEWTWLPEQTLLPISWGHDQVFGTTSDEVMHPMDPNIDDGNEDEIEFGVSIILLSFLLWNSLILHQNPFYLSLPPSAQDSADQSNVAPFFPFSTESESDAAFFAVPHFDFEASCLGLQDDHLDAFPDVSQLSDHAVESITHDYGLRMYNVTTVISIILMRSHLGRDSISSTASGYELPDCSDTYFSFSSDSIRESLGFTSEELGTQYPESKLSFEPIMSSELPDPIPTPIDQTPLATLPRVPRRDSIASQSSCTSPDGLLCPPVTSPVHPQGQSRVKKVPASRSLSLDAPNGYNDVRSIPTPNFGANGGIMTSVLIPMAAPRYDPDIERDLEEYSRALESVVSDSQAKGAHSFMSSFQLSPSAGMANGKGKYVKRQNRADELDINPGFDFEAEFGDIIDIQHPSERSATA